MVLLDGRRHGRERHPVFLVHLQFFLMLSTNETIASFMSRPSDLAFLASMKTLGMSMMEMTMLAQLVRYNSSISLSNALSALLCFGMLIAFVVREWEPYVPQRPFGYQRTFFL